MEALSPKHPLLSAGNLLEGCAGLLAISAGVLTILSVGPILSAWVSLIFACTTTIVAFMSAYHLWKGN